MSSIRKLPGYKDFSKQCMFFDPRNESEYGRDWSGREKFILITDLSREDIVRDYPEINSELSPYLLLPEKYKPIFRAYWSNEDKARRHSELDYDNLELLESLFADMAEDAPEDSMIDSLMVRYAINQLQPVAQYLIWMRYFAGEKWSECSLKIGLGEKTLQKRLKKALETMKCTFAEGGDLL